MALSHANMQCIRLHCHCLVLQHSAFVYQPLFVSRMLCLNIWTGDRCWDTLVMDHVGFCCYWHITSQQRLLFALAPELVYTHWPSTSLLSSEKFETGSVLRTFSAKASDKLVSKTCDPVLGRHLSSWVSCKRYGVT